MIVANSSEVKASAVAAATAGHIRWRRTGGSSKARARAISPASKNESTFMPTASRLARLTAKLMERP